MDLSIKVISIPPSASGVSQRSGESWFKGYVVGEVLPSGQYPKKVIMSVFGKDKWDGFGFVVNGQYQVSFDIDAHEYNGRWYNEIQIWKAVRIDGQQQKTARQGQIAGAQPAPSPAPATQQTDEEQQEDDLPF